MLPVLFTIGKFPVGTYGVFAALAVIAAIGLARILARRSGLDDESVMDVFVYSILAGLIGSKLFMLIIFHREFAASPWRFIMNNVRSFGLPYTGLGITAIVAMIIIKKQKMPVWRVLDVAAPSLLLAVAMSRWGCFFAGCSYGKPSTLPWAMYFPAVPLCTNGVRIHPWPLYALVADIVILGALIFLFSQKRFDGQVFTTGAFLFSLSMFLLGFLRGDTFSLPRPFQMFSLFQLQMLFTFILAAILYAVLRKRCLTGTWNE